MGSTLEPIDPGRLTGAAAELYAHYSDGRRMSSDAGFRLVTESGQLLGPPAAWMLSPELGLGLERAGYALRFNLSLSARAREIVILMVAAAEDSDFERFAHRQAARHAGLSDSEIAMLDSGDFVPVDESEAVLVATARSILDLGDLEASGYASAVETLGRQAIVEIVTLIGWYRLMAMQLRVFDLEPPPPRLSTPEGE